MKKIADLYIYLNLHISVSNVLFFASAFVLFQKRINLPYLAFIGFSSFVVYNAHRFFEYHRSEIYRSKRHIIFQQISSPIKWILAGIAFGGGILSFQNLTNTTKFYLILPSLLTLFYLVPFRKNKRIKDIPYIKTVVLAMVYASLYIIPVYENEELICLLVLIENFCFFMALTVPFDIRDRELDIYQHTKTIGNVLDGNKSYYFSYAFIFFACICLFFQLYIGLINNTLTFLLCLFYLVLWVCIHISKGKTERYYLLVLDSLIGLKGLMIIIYFGF